MAIIDNNTQNQNQASAAPAQPQAAQQNAQRQASPFWSFHQTGLINTPVAAGIGGEYFTKFRQELLDIYKDIAAGLQISVISLNRQNIPQLRFSALVVAVRYPEVADNISAFHVLLLEATGEKLQPVSRNVDNQNIFINRVTGDAWDQVLYTQALNAVQAEYPNTQVLSAQAMVIPSQIGFDNKAALENIARNAALACVSVINAGGNGNNPLNLAYMDKECRFVLDVTFGNHQVVDVVDQPQRSSVLIGYSSQKKNANSIAGTNIDTVNVPDAVAKICELSGFINAIWAPSQQNYGLGFMAYQNPNVPRPTQTLAAEFVVTNVDTPFATSPAAVLLALSSTLALVDGDTWIQSFLPKGLGSKSYRTERKEVDITDIGALNIPANLGNQQDLNGFGAPVDMDELEGDLTKINTYIVSLFHPGLAVSFDCPEVGPQTWYLAAFAAAASGDQEAYNQIYNAAEELTNGQFSKYFKHGDAMFSNVTRVPLGYYMVGDKKHDLRGIDYTAICNIFAKNPQVIHEYSNTFVDRPGVSAARNLAIREGIIRDACNQQAVITGYAARVTAKDTLIKALSQAIADTGLPVQVNTPLNADQLRLGVAAPSFVAQSLARDTRTFQNNYATRPAAQYRFGSYFGGNR